jgi:3-hydroxybutyryl-CoA dehydrogenase
VAAGRHGRKTGTGFYDYRNGPHRAPDPEPPAPGGGEGRTVVIGGRGPVAEGLRERATAAGFVVPDLPDDDHGHVHLAIDADPERRIRLVGTARDAPRAVLCAGQVLRDSRDTLVCGFHLVGPVAETRLVETTATAATEREAIGRTEDFFRALGLHVERVADAPGLVLGRIVAQLVNEAAFAIGEGVGTPADVDAATTLGLNHPRGPIAWAEATGLPHVRAILRALHADRGEERYRTAPLLLSGSSALRA